jgi:hypothetical protein
MWHVLLRIPHGLTYERLGIRLLIDKLENGSISKESRSLTILYGAYDSVRIGVNCGCNYPKEKRGRQG